MHFPVSVNIFHAKIPLHVILEPVAFFVGFRYYVLQRKQQGDTIGDNNRLWIILGAIVGAIFGSRLIGGLENIPQMLTAGNKLLYFYQNKTVLGGFLGGVAGVELIKKIIGEHQNSGDLFVFPMILALIIGRIGCFSMGIYEETYGLPTSLFTGIDLGDGIPRHPLVLYEIVFLALLWLMLKELRKKYVLANGLLFKLFMIAYCLFRFAIDFIKPHYGMVVSTIQVTALLGLCYYFIVFLINKPVFSFNKR